jgi:hypothetical protein
MRRVSTQADCSRALLEARGSSVRKRRREAGALGERTISIVHKAEE